LRQIPNGINCGYPSSHDRSGRFIQAEEELFASENY
jgi:hypothetical protein